MDNYYNTIDEGSETVKRTLSPYDLSLNDNPGSVITQVQTQGVYQGRGRDISVRANAAQTSNGGTILPAINTDKGELTGLSSEQ